MKFSIVVPFYNTQMNYFNRMVKSLMLQVYKEFEIVIVNDGSSKENEKKLQEYDFGDLQVKIINQKNKGLSAARNTGIRNALGEYVVFLDSDDALPEKMLKQAKEYLDQFGKPDVIFGRMVYCILNRENQMKKMDISNCSSIDRDGYKMSLLQNRNSIQYYDNVSKINRVKVKLLHQDNESILLGSSGANIYKKSILLNCLFDEEVRICEDQIFNRNILNNISTCLVVPDEWYYYIQYYSSMLHDQAKKIDINKTFSYWDKIELIDEKENDEIVHFSNIHNVGLVCDEIKKMCLSEKNYFFCRGKIKKLYNHKMVKKAMDDKNISGNNINSLKLFLFRHKFTFILFYLYYIKTKKESMA